MIRGEIFSLPFDTFKEANHSSSRDILLIKSDLMDLLNKGIADRSKDPSPLISTNDSNLMEV